MSNNKIKKGDLIFVKPKQFFLKAEVINNSNNKVVVKYIDNDHSNKYKNKVEFLKKDVKLYNKNLNSTKKKKKKDMVEPLFWIMPNKKEFPNWINKTFIKYKSNGVPLIPNKKIFKPFKYQNFVRDYMQELSPYRGILLYHGLGSGKTCTAINISENLKDKRNIIVMLPASLRSNFIEDGLKFCGDKKYKHLDQLIKQKYSFISYNASNTIDQIEKISSFDNKTVIVDEIHNLVSMMVSSIRGQSKQGEYIYKTLMEAHDLKIIALSGTPIINQPFEIAILFNILRGYLETVLFNIGYVPAKYGKTWELNEVITKLEENKYIDFIDLNKQNKTFEIHYTIKSWDHRFDDVTDYIIDTCESFNIKVELIRVKKNTLFPEDEEEFNKYFIDDSDSKSMVLKNQELFKRRILGLVSYYASKNSNLPTIIKDDTVEIDMSDYQYNMYEAVRLIEKKFEKGGGKKQNKNSKSKGPSSLMRIFSRQFSNFVFPEDVDRPYIERLLKLGKSTKKNDDEEKDIKKIEKIENKTTKKDKAVIENALNKLSLGADKYLKGTNLKKYSPKMNSMLDVINNSPGTCFVYSDFRTLEGVEIFSRVLQANSYTSFIKDKLSDKNKFAMYTGSEKFEDREEMLKVFNSPDNKYGKIIKVLLVTKAGAEGLDLKNIRSVLIMEPYWNEVRIKQVIGRAVRRGSHINLPEKDRNVSIFRFITKFTEKQIKNSQLKEKLTTDEYILDIAYRKQKLIDIVLEITKVMAVDCVLNRADNKGDFKCFSFPNDTGLSYIPEISKDLVYTYSNIPTKEVNKILTIGALTKDKTVVVVDKANKKYYKAKDKNKKNPYEKKPKLVKKVAIDLDKNIIYDYDSVKSNSPVKIGKINKNSLMS